VLAQTTTSIVSTGAKDGSVATSLEETLVAHPTLKVTTTQDSTRTLTSEAPVVTLAMNELLVQFVPALMGVTSAPPLTFESAPTIVVVTRSMNVPAKPAPIVDILEDLILHMINQLFSMITYCTKLVLSRCTPFKFVRSLLENHVENIQKVGGFDRVKVC